MSTREIFAFPTTLSILRKYAQKALCTKTPLSSGVTGKTFTDTEKKNEKKKKPTNETQIPTGFGNPVNIENIWGKDAKVRSGNLLEYENKNR